MKKLFALSLIVFPLLISVIHQKSAHAFNGSNNSYIELKNERSGSCFRRDMRFTKNTSGVRLLASDICVFPTGRINSYQKLGGVVWTGGVGADVEIYSLDNKLDIEFCTIGEEKYGFSNRCDNPMGSGRVQINIKPHHDRETTYFKLIPE
jgi:hypothetical protein